MTHAELMRLTTNPISAWLMRRRLRAQIHAMECAAGHFADMTRMGLRGEKWAHEQLANLKPVLQDLGR